MASNISNTLPICPVTGTLLPHRDAMGVPTFRVRVLDAVAVAKLLNGGN